LRKPNLDIECDWWIFVVVCESAYDGVGGRCEYDVVYCVGDVSGTCVESDSVFVICTGGSVVFINGVELDESVVFGSIYCLVLRGVTVCRYFWRRPKSVGSDFGECGDAV